jgi:hypothetical protein
MAANEKRNTYLEQVVAQQSQLEQDLRSKRSMPQAQAPESNVGGSQRARTTTAAAQPHSGAVDVRITGFGRWKTVLVPPNAFVVHTRRGRTEPLHVGLGVSFRYNPALDSFLVVPGALQTILINAFCICRELQGVLVQAYVQWIIQDFGTAYRKLDFSDLEDPMRLVNLQLREQAEAAIKDKVSTMSVHEVLSDKQPIIEELTARLRDVAEGEGGTDTGLGLRIVTVQIKEAVVSSARLWENLQKPFRSEQGRLARLAEVDAESAIGEREAVAARIAETQAIGNARELAELRARTQAITFDREAAEGMRRAHLEQENARVIAELESETARHALNLERESSELQTELGRLRLEAEHLLKQLAQEGALALAEAQVRAEHDRELLDIDRVARRAVIVNEQSAASIQQKLIERLPAIVAALPKPDELRSVTIGGSDSTTVAGLLGELTAVIGALRSVTAPPGSH